MSVVNKLKAAVTRHLLRRLDDPHGPRPNIAQHVPLGVWTQPIGPGIEVLAVPRVDWQMQSARLDWIEFHTSSRGVSDIE